VPQEELFGGLQQHEEFLTKNIQELDRANGELNLEIAEYRRVETEWRDNLGRIRIGQRGHLQFYLTAEQMSVPCCSA
jgi:hypothetical protein